MFLGEFQHSLDDKGRIILPARFRDELPSRVYLTGEIDGCLALWNESEFTTKAEEMRDRLKGNRSDRDVARAFFATAAQAELTGQGRMVIPANLRTFAGLEREVVVNGMFDHIEIWDAAAWRERRTHGERTLAEGDTE